MSTKTLETTSTAQSTMSGFRKRDGDVVSFHRAKIESSITPRKRSSVAKTAPSPKTWPSR